MLDAADVLVDGQPVVGRGGVGRRLRMGAVKRAKYHDESTNVSIVSVSRVASPPHCGQATCFHVGWWSSGLPGRRRRRRPAGAPAGPCPVRARRRTSRNGSRGSGSPNSAGARCPSREGDTVSAPCPIRSSRTGPASGPQPPGRSYCRARRTSRRSARPGFSAARRRRPPTRSPVSAGTKTSMTGKPYFRAKSRSR